MTVSDNRFERLRDKLADRIKRQQVRVYDAFGVGKRPYGHVALSREEQREFWIGMPPEQKQQVWTQITPAEQKAIVDLMKGGVEDAGPE